MQKTEEGKREPVDPGHEFTCDDRKVLAILDFENPSEEPAEDLQVGWIKPESDKEDNRVSLSVKTKKTYRTWAFNSYVNKKPGTWQVVIRDSDGTILARAAFVMQE
jgi:hypothetical protein